MESPTIRSLSLQCFRIPTDSPEGDGTLAWDATEALVVQVEAGGWAGLGLSYTQAEAAATLIRDKLIPCLEGQPALDTVGAWQRMNRQLRNVGRPGLGLMAISAVDQALWDWKARFFGQPLAALWGRVRESAPAYGSGGFTSYDETQLTDQLGGWARQGLRAVKMKVGAHPAQDLRRVERARRAVGPKVELMVDANGAYDRRQALALGCGLAEQHVVWFEEPVSSDDLDGLRWLRDRTPDGLAIAAGEYGWDAHYFGRMLRAGAVDVLQADATRCGYTGFLQAAALCEASKVKLSAHCAPAIHAPICTTVGPFAHLEYFHDHVRVESLLFEHVPALEDGGLRPLDITGTGLALRRDADRYAMA